MASNPPGSADPDEPDWALVDPGRADLISEFYRTPKQDLVANDVTPAKPDEQYDMQARAEGERLQQANRLRSVFFYFAVGTASLCVAATTFFMGMLIFQGKTTDTIVIAFITGLTVETLGITAIMARYLFPGPDKEAARP